VGLRRPRLAQRRVVMGFSQEDLAEAVEVDRTTAIRWECPAVSRSGEVSMPLPVHRPRLAKALQVSLDELDDMLADILQVDDGPTLSTATARAGDDDNSSRRVATVVHHRRAGAGRCWCSQATVAWWGGRETFALRRALRLSVRAFAEHIGTSVSTVTGWEDQRGLVSPGTGMQAVLDQVLKQAEPGVRARFWLILAGHTIISGEPVSTGRRRVPHEVGR
jgi:transcriptional regulator with XRE-family HTH domain